MIQRDVSKAGLVGGLGKTGDVNVQGEEVQKLDEMADKVIFRALDHTGHLCVMASEEQEDVLRIPEQWPRTFRGSDRKPFCRLGSRNNKSFPYVWKCIWPFVITSYSIHYTKLYDLF